jgi:hypothetical protein
MSNYVGVLKFTAMVCTEPLMFCTFNYIVVRLKSGLKML